MENLALGERPLFPDKNRKPYPFPFDPYNIPSIPYYPYKPLRYLTRPNLMTLIIGSRCSNGVVMIADKRVTGEEGSVRLLQDKLQSNLDKHVWGASGNLAFFTSFKYRVKVLLAENGDEDGKVPAPRVMPLIEQAYAELLGMYPYSLLPVVANNAILIGSSLESKTKLYLIEGLGFHLIIDKWQTIGTGSPYAQLFLKKLWKPSMNMEEVAELGFFVIKLIERYDLDATVGVDNQYPQVYYLTDNQPIREGNQYELQFMKEKIDRKIAKWDSGLQDFLSE